MKQASKRLRVLIADDHRVFRSGLRAILSADADMDVVGEASTGEEAVALARERAPDVVLMDLNMPGISGIDATRAILSTAPETAILIVTMVDDETSLFAAMRAGARGYLLKGADGEETWRAIRAVASGEAIFSPGVARRLLGYFSARPRAEKAQPAFPELTEREREILDLIASGLSNAAIAERLVLSPKTVRNNVSNVFAKLQVTGRAEAIVCAREAGFGRTM